MSKHFLLAACTGLALCVDPVSAQTIEVDRAALAPSVQADDMIVVTAKMPMKPSSPRSRHMLSNAELNEQRGGEQLIVTNQTLTAITQGNVLNGDFLAGDVNLSDSAL